MTPRERVLTALRRQQPDRVPYEINGFNRVAWARFRTETGSTDPDAYFGVETAVERVDFLPTAIDLKDRYLPLHELPPNVIYKSSDENIRKDDFLLDEWGTAFIAGTDPAYDHLVPPAKIVRATSISEIENYPLPDFMNDYRHRHFEKSVAEIKNRQRASVIYMEMTIFEASWQIRGLDQLLTDFIMDEQIAACLLDRVTAISAAKAARVAKAGVDIMRIGDDVGMKDRMMLSPQMWQKWLKPRLAKVIATAKTIKPDLLVSYHSDGFIEPIIPELIEIGIDILNPVQPECMDPEKIKNLYGNKLAFWGTISVQQTLPFGTVKDVEDEVRLRIATVGKGGGLMLGPSHVIAPEVPHDNLRALVNAVQKYGTY
jgi:uroporphyrinogen decarboxylase